MPKVRNLLLSALEGIPSKVPPNDLTYLALTGKPELRVRDEVALHLSMALPKSMVAREWTRPIPVKHPRNHPCDLAVLSGVDGSPLHLVELKAMYTYDPLINGKTAMSLPKQLISDCEVRIKEYGTPTSGILLATHVLSPIGKPYGWRIVKYDDAINRGFRQNASEQKIASRCKQKVEDLFKARGYWHSGRRIIKAGSSLGTRVEVHYWVIEKQASASERALLLSQPEASQFAPASSSRGQIGKAT